MKHAIEILEEREMRVRANIRHLQELEPYYAKTLVTPVETQMLQDVRAALALLRLQQASKENEVTKP